MPTFTVKAASKKKDVPDARFGPAQVIALKLSNGDGEKDAEWFTRATTPLPAPGQTLEGELEPSEYGLKFKKAQSGGGGFSRSPRDSARIEHQHSQEMALRAIALEIDHNADPPADTATWRAYIKDWTNWFVADLDGADVGGGGRQSGIAQAPAGAGGQPAVAPANSAADVSSGPSTPQMDFLERLLIKADVHSDTRSVIAAYAKDNLTPGREGSMSKTLDRLKDGDADFFARLKTAAEEWAASHSDVPADRTPSPEEQAIPDDEGIPF